MNHNRRGCRCLGCEDLRRALGIASFEEADVALLSRLLSDEAFYEIDGGFDQFCIEITIGRADVERMRSLIARIADEVALATRVSRAGGEHHAAPTDIASAWKIGRDRGDRPEP